MIGGGTQINPIWVVLLFHAAIISFLMIISQNTFVIGEITEEYKSFIGLFFIVIISSIVRVLDEKKT